MTIPSISLSEQNPGLGQSRDAPTAWVLFGVCSSGAGSVHTINNPADAVSKLGQGPLVEDAAFLTNRGGGPVYAVPVVASTAGSNSAVAVTRVDSSTGTLTLSGTPNDSYNAKIEILSTGDKGTATFRYSLDNGRTWSPTLTSPSSTYLIPNTGVTLTWVSGAGAVYFETGDVHTFTTTAGRFNAANLATAVTTFKAANIASAVWMLCGTDADSADGATLAGALDGHLATLQTEGQDVQGICHAGAESAANTKADWVAQLSDRIAVTFGDVDVLSSKPFTGWVAPTRPALTLVAPRCQQALISTDLSRTGPSSDNSSGALPGVAPPLTANAGPPITHDEFKQQTMDADGFLTLRTWPGQAGVYITNGRIKSSPGSDFTDWHLRRMMNVAKTTTRNTLFPLVGSSVDVKSDGTIAEVEAKRIEAQAYSALDTALLQPLNAEGTKGHVAAVTVRVDRTEVVSTTNNVTLTIELQKRGYLKTITATLGFVVTVSEAA